MISADFLGSELSELIAVKNGPRDFVYFGTCKAALSYILLGESLLEHKVHFECTNYIIHGSKNLLRREILDTRRYFCVRENCRQHSTETMCMFVMAFHQYIRIGKFVCALVLFAKRYYQSASVDCSGAIDRIHMKELKVRKEIASMMKMIAFMPRGR